MTEQDYKQFQGLIYKVAAQYIRNSGDPAFDLDDFVQEGRIVLWTVLRDTKLTCAVTTALVRQLKQRYNNIYRNMMTRRTSTVCEIDGDDYGAVDDGYTEKELSSEALDVLQVIMKAPADFVLTFRSLEKLLHDNGWKWDRINALTARVRAGEEV